jgi:hypothetical protein
MLEGCSIVSPTLRTTNLAEVRLPTAGLIHYVVQLEWEAGPAGGSELPLVGAKVVPVRNKMLLREMQTHTWPASAEYT